MPLINPGNMFSRGEWKYCDEYDPGDVVRRAGVFYMAARQNAGVNPLDVMAENTWLPLGERGGGEAVAGYAWHTYFHELTAEDIENKYVDLPEDIPPAKSGGVVLSVETDVQAPTEYEVC
jgi:hypothetical protein